MEIIKLNLIMECCEHILSFNDNIQQKNYFNAALYESSAETLAMQIENFDKGITKLLIEMLRSFTPDDYENYMCAMMEI